MANQVTLYPSVGMLLLLMLAISIEVTDIGNRSSSREIPTGHPGTPTIISATSTSIMLSWTEIPCLDQNGVITSYIIHYGEQTNRNRILVTMSAIRFFDVTGLKPYTDYTFTVAGVNSAGSGPMSTPSYLNITRESIPTVVLNLKFDRDLISVDLAWDEPSPSNGVITHYTITYSVNGSVSITNTSTDTLFRITGLLPQTLVSAITVTASTSVGPGPAAMLVVTTLNELPMIDNVRVIVLTDTSVGISWDDPQLLSITHYEVKYSLTGTRNSQDSVLRVKAPAKSTDITGLVYNGRYNFEVTAITVIEGTEVKGLVSKVVTADVICTCCRTQSVNEGRDSTTIITAFLVFLLTIILYSIFVALVILSCHLYKKRGSGDKNTSMDINVDKTIYETVDRSPNMEMKKNITYDAVHEEEDAQHYEALEHEDDINSNQ